jgi:hypothetical protein
VDIATAKLNLPQMALDKKNCNIVVDEIKETQKLSYIPNQEL